jgi:hypothetical protein
LFDVVHLPVYQPGPWPSTAKEYRRASEEICVSHSLWATAIMVQLSERVEAWFKHVMFLAYGYIWHE